MITLFARATAVAAVALALAAASVQADVLDQQQTQYSNASGNVSGPQFCGQVSCPAYDPTSIAQVFTAGLSGQLDRVQLFLQSVGSEQDPLTIEITDTSSAAPGPTVLASTEIQPASVPSSGGWVEADFSTAAQVSAGAQYAIVVIASGSDRYLWDVGPSGSYSGGNEYYEPASPPQAGGWLEDGSSPTAAAMFKTYVAATAAVSPAPPTFASQPQSTLSPPQTVTLTNTSGEIPLAVSGLTFTGADAGDFLITSDGCMGQLAPGASCQLTVAFAPQGEGSRSATLQIGYDQLALTVPLAGVGGALPQGPAGAAGPQGQAGPQGAMGATGSEGPPGQVELITCKTITKRVGGHRRKVQRCAGRLVSGTITFTTGQTAHATMSRHDLTYATGALVGVIQDQTLLVLARRRPMPAGRYTLTVRRRAGRRWVSARSAIVLG